MLSVGFDLHKRYSRVEALEDNGERRAAGRLVNEFEQIEGFFRRLGEPCRVVLEAGWNWGAMYDWLERVENVVEVQLAHPYGVRAIAAALVKAGQIDARMMGQLLRVEPIGTQSRTGAARRTTSPTEPSRGQSESAPPAASLSGSMVGPAPTRSPKAAAPAA
jgi:hypothetical protein